MTIDGREVRVPEGTTVIRAAEKLGIFIPRYCYHPGLSIAGNCRICLVQVEGAPKLEIACNLEVRDGMVVHTKSPEAEDGRRGVLEFLLANHPLDCPVCDQSGECDLQDFYMEFGRYDPRFREHKVKKRKAVRLGPHVMLDQERCILCSRCVRFTDEITGTGELGIFGRGDRTELSIYPGEVLDNPYSANVVDICPVGALTESDFRFKVRVWYMSSAPTVCNGCSRGCSMDLHYVLDRPHLNDGARVVRVKPRYHPEVNEWWLCDEGRFGFDWVDRDRLEEVRGPAGDGPAGDGPATDGPAKWDEALDAVAAALRTGAQGGSGEAGTGERVGVIASARLSCEELFLVRELFGRRLGARVSAAVPEEPGTSDDLLVRADKNPNTLGATLLGLAGEGAPPAGEIVEAALAGGIDVLWVMGHDLDELFGEETARALAERVGLLVFSGTNENRTVPLAHWVLPTAAYVENEGTFVNCDGRVQRFAPAFPPLGAAREEWRLLLELAERLAVPFDWRTPGEVFGALATAEEPFAGLGYEALGERGALVDLPAGVAAP